MECKDGNGATTASGSTGFNRYIVECKEQTDIINSIQCLDLIDTLWNVKAIGREWFDNNYDDLIDTLWNVK